MVLEEALRGLERGWSELYFCVVFHPGLKPTADCEAFCLAIVDAYILINGFFQLLFDFRLCLAEDVLDNCFSGFGKPEKSINLQNPQTLAAVRTAGCCERALAQRSCGTMQQAAGSGCACLQRTSASSGVAAPQGCGVCSILQQAGIRVDEM